MRLLDTIPNQFQAFASLYSVPGIRLLLIRSMLLMNQFSDKSCIGIHYSPMPRTYIPDLGLSRVFLDRVSAHFLEYLNFRLASRNWEDFVSQCSCVSVSGG